MLINNFKCLFINNSISIVIDSIDMENTIISFSPSPAMSVDINQHAKNRHSYFNNLENDFFSTNKYCIKIIIATKAREMLKNAFMVLNPNMSKQAGFKNVAKANRINRNLIVDDIIYYISMKILRFPIS